MKGNPHQTIFSKTFTVGNPDRIHSPVNGSWKW